MIPKRIPLTKLVLVFGFLLGSFFYASAQEVAPFAPRLAGGNIEIRGDIIFVGNNTLNRATQANPAQANTPYNGTANNNSLWMEYIDIDGVVDLNGDGNDDTFSSSSAELNIADPTCSQVRYAGLYWAATYPNERSTNGSAQFSGTPRIEDWFNIKFQVPGGSYVDLTADTAADTPGQEDDIIYDGYNYSNINNSFKDSPYICYKNVTDLVRGNTNPNGEYTVANVRATKGRRNGSSSAGWVMVIIYENPNESGKFISTFDGYAGMSSAAGNVDVAVNGFRTLPTPFPVRARVGVGALEGDRGIRNDRFFLKANSNTNFTNLSTGLNPTNNFFNSTITLNGSEVPTRTPYGTNTLGTDLDLFNLNNPTNSVLPNSESGATLRFTSTGDGYGSFLAVFAVEIIEPNIVLEKRVEDIAGNDITDGGVNLGQTLDYVLSFRNLGNDDAVNYSIRDVLPLNTSYVSFDVSGAPGVTASVDPTTNQVTFSIPDDLVEIGDPAYSIRLRVKVAENCFDFVDACSDQIQNLAYSTYQGDINSAVITDDPSVSDFDNCGFVTPGATNFLLDDLSACNFFRTAQLCGDNVVLDAGDGFDSYVWVRDDNNNGQIDGSDTTMNDGDPDGDPSTLLVDDVGVYIVDKIIPDPCKGFKEIITVERFGTTQNNPIVDYFNATNSDADPTNDIQGEIVQCSIDGDLLPKIFLCGTNDSQLMQINITDAQSLSWEKLNEASCTAAPDDCANKNLGCTWSQEGTGNNYMADTAGKYRLVINYTNGCFSRFYFDVFQNVLDIQYNRRDIICTRDGRIRITNLGSNYGYQLVDDANNSILIPFSAGQGPRFDFTSGQNGSYRVEVVQLDGSGNPIVGACIFSTEPIGIRDRAFQVDIETTPANCNAQGTIKIDVSNVRADYTYVLKRADGTLIDDETAQSDNTHTFSVNAGDYIIETSSRDGCFDTQNVTVARIPDPTLSALTTMDIGCTPGSIELTRTGGQGNPDFLYAIWSKNGTDLYPNITSIPADAYQVASTFTFGWRDDDGDGTDEYIPGEDGTYEFVIIDANNCFAFSNPVMINDNGTTTIDSITETQPSCSGDSDGELIVNVSGGIAPYQYSIDNGTTYQTTPSFVNLSTGTYTIRVLDDSGCDFSQSYDLSEPFPLSASAGVSRDATCDPNGAEVRITNVVGGNGTYQYSFDGGATYGASTIAVLPPGDYTVIVSDGSCEFPMAVTVEDVPDEPDVILTPEVSYLCDGSAVVTATPNITTYNYTYALDGVPNSPDPTSNVFPNVPPGTYTVSTNYVSQTPPTPSLLLSEDFGSGNGTIPSPNTVGYFYEAQTTGANPDMRPGDTNTRINDYEYGVTNRIAAPFGPWISPNDHTNPSDPNGRFLVINVGTPSPGQIIYSKPINDVIPSRPLSISLQIFNLLISTNGQLDPDLTIEIREPGTGTVVQSIRTGDIAKNTGPDDWVEFTADLNPGINTSLDFVIRTQKVGNSGNDFALDDIEIFQIPEVCELTVETAVAVVAGNVFAANVSGATSVSCNGLDDASITFDVENFDAVAGFEYSVDNTPFILSTTSPVTTTATLGAGSHTIEVRKANEIACSRTITRTISEPGVLVANASITTAQTCDNGGATITASASGGTPTYEYQLEDALGTVIGGFDFATNGNNTVFTSLATGDYIVRVRDTNTCEDAIDKAIPVAPINPVTFSVVPTTCHTGGSTASVEVNVTNGNGGYQFRIDGGPWQTPTPANATTYTFQNLANGTYDIEVRDALGCPLPAPAPQTVTINPQLTVSASAPNITACATDTDITISASGGNMNYVYAVVPNGNALVDGDFGIINPFTVTVAGNYDVHIRDNAGAAGYCSAVYTINIVKDAPIAITATPTAVNCFGGSNGAISIVVDSGGNSPFMYSIDNGVTYVPNNSFPNLIAGTYPVRVRDANLCESVPEDVIVSEPLQLTAEAAITENYTCLVDGEISVGSVLPTSGGSGDYQYSLNGGSWTASTTGGHTFIGLTDNTYSIRVRDANATSCEITLPGVIIDPLPTEPTVTTSVTYNCDGTGNVTVLPSDPSYSYSIDTGLAQSSNLFTNVTVGSHPITVDYGSGCTVNTTVIVADGNAFEASITAFENLGCNGDASGSITIDAANYGTGGFEYRVNSNPFVGPFSAAQQITALNAAAHTIEVRDVDNALASLPGCTITLNQTLTEPALVVASGSITEDIACSNSGATITVSASGGTPIYTYQLEDDLGNVIPGFDFVTNGSNTVFNSLPDGNYAVRARDLNNCEGTSATITVDPVDTIVFTETHTACYNGGNNAAITVNVTSGNTGYQFNIDNGSGPGPWITPTPAAATSFTFSGLSNGTYTVNVRDSKGCGGTVATEQTITINPQLVVAVDVTDISACNDGAITVNASGGNGTLVYAIVPANTSQAGLYTTTSSLSVTAAMATANPAGYDVYVLDNNGASPSCSFLEEDIILTPVATLTASGTATDPECFDGLGFIDATVGGGTGPFTYTLTDLSPADGIDYGRTNSNIATSTLPFNGIGVGDYEITITDTNSCTVTSATVTINNATEITADIIPILPAACNDPDPLQYGFEFDNVITPSGTVRYSADGGSTWQASNELRGYGSGTEVFPSIQVEVAPGVYCQRDLDRYIIPFPLDDLDITLSAIIVGCNDLRVTVEGSEGNPVPGYEYTYTDDPANFSTFISDPNVWTAPLPSGTSHTFQNIDPVTPQYPEVPLLVPGRSYVFYVRDGAGCIRQSNVNVNDIPGIGLPIEVTTDVTPSCNGAANGAITFTFNPTNSYPQMRWEVFELGNTTPIEVSGGGASAVNVPYNNTIPTSIPLAEGDYYITITQVDGSNVDACMGAGENVYVPELNPLTATGLATRDISCNLPGLISINSISGGGGAPYTYDVTGPVGFVALTGATDNPVQVPVNSPAGNYTVTLNDQYGCSFTLAPVALTLSANPTIASVTQDNCSSPINLTVVGASAAGNIRYAIVAAGNPAPTTYLDNGGLFTDIAVGSYDIYVTDGNGCSVSQSAFVVHPVLSATAGLTKTLDCTASPEAVINIEVLTGSGSYEYSISNTAGAPAVAQTAIPGNSFDYLAPAPGDYTITVYDTNTPSNASCNREFVVNVPARLEPVVNTISTTDVTCIGDADGTITISAVDNAIGPYTFEITSMDGAPVSISPTSSTNTSASFTGLAPTTTAAGYIVALRGDTTTNNCPTNSVSITIAEPSAVTVTMNTPVEFACTVGNNGNSANISVQSISGGSNTFVRYQFINDLNPGTPVQDGSNDTYIETDQAGGNYTINVFDDNGCVGTATASIAPFDELLPATITIDQAITCLTGENITVNALGSITDSSTPAGLANYEFRQLPSGVFAASNTFTNLAVGTHDFEVRNVNTNCVVSVSHTVSEPNNFEITATTVDVVCDGTDGSVSFTINDPINPYLDGFAYQIFATQGTVAIGDDVLVSGAPIASANVGPTAPYAIGAGEYRVEITQDSNPTCVASELFTIAEPNGVISGIVVSTPVTCAGNDGIIEITNAEGGWGGLTYFVALASNPAPTFPGSYVASPRFTALSGGIAPGTDYQVWIADSQGCEMRLADVTLVDPTPISADLQINQPNCTDLSAEIEVINEAGGQGNNYSYQLQVLNTTTSLYENIRSIQNTAIFSGLGAGQYQVIVSDQWSCSNPTTNTITIYAPITPLVTVLKTIDCSTTDPEGQITVSQTGGSGNFDYLVTYPDGFTMATNSTGVFTGLGQVGDYIFTITDQDPAQACPINITQRLDTAVYPVLSVDSSTNVSCNGANDGTISMSVTDNGAGPYTFTIISGPGSSATFPIAATSSTNTSAIFAGLEGSIGGITYTIEARGANNCEVTTTVVITELDVISVDPMDVVQYGCTNGNNSENASVSFLGASGGTNTFVRYVFLRNGTVVQDGVNTTYFETDRLGGNYEIRVFDDAGCFATSATDTVLPFVEISDPTVTTTQDAACLPLNNAQIEVGVTLNPASATQNLEYTVTGINVTYNQTIASTNNTETFTGLEFGNYRVSITNLDTGCVIETVHNIDNPDVIEVIVTKLTDEECLNNGVDDGSFSVAINNYTGNYAYQVYDINDNPVLGAGFSGTGNTGTALPPISNLSGGVYYIRVTATDAPLCEDDSNVITVLAPSAPITAIVREEPNPFSVTCSNDQGRLLVDPTGGKGPYTITIDSGSQNFTETNVEAFIFQGLSAGSFHVTITDAFGCILSQNIDLERPDDIVTTIAATPLTCFDGNTASVNALVNIRNVSPVYQYRLNRYDNVAGSNLLQTSAVQNGATFNGLAAGFYSITVTDDVSCSGETPIVEIVNPTEVEAQLIRTSPLTCTTGVEFELSATGGSGTYEYSANNTTWLSMTGNSVNLPLSGILSAGVYSYYVRDAINLCTASLSNSIEEDIIEPLTLTVNTSAAVINCNGESTAVIYAAANGGLGNYMYELFTDSALTNSVTGAAQNDGQFSGLSDGTYHVSVTSEDCTSPAEEVIITEPERLSVVDPNNFTNVSCFGANDGTITVELEGGVAPYQYAISPSLNKFDEENVFTDLEGSPIGITYTVIAQDSNGCFVELQYTIVEPEVLDVSAISLPEVCEGEENGSIELTITGGTAPYSTRLGSENNFVQDRTQILNLAGGDYIVFIRDAQGCEENIVVTVDFGVNLSATVEPVYGCNGIVPSNYVNIVLEDTSIAADVLYGLDSTDPADMQLNPYFRDIAPGMHYIAISHANGCVTSHDFEIFNFEPLTISVEQTNINEITATVAGGKEAYTIYFGDVNNGSDNTYFINRTDTYIVTVVDENGCEATASIYMEFIDIEIPNFFTPNGDGENESWKPRNDEGFPEILTIIFDRYGREVYRIGQGDPGWDGFYQQTELPTGDYWYIIKLNGENDDREFVGHFTLYR